MMRTGMTVIEMVITLTVIAIVLGIVVPSAARFRDGVAVRNASAEAVAAFAVARQSAIVRGARAELAIDDPPGTITVSVGGASLMRRDLEGTYGIALTSTRDSTAYSPLGLGHGVANLRMVLERGRVAETIFVSREGRVRR
jgi:prepilin-type N-terminal cleavage/methylation domain-containing protein